MEKTKDAPSLKKNVFKVTQKLYQEMNFALRQLSLSAYPAEQEEEYATSQSIRLSQKNISTFPIPQLEGMNLLTTVLLPMRNQRSHITIHRVVDLENQIPSLMN